MAKIELKGTIYEVSPVTKVGANETPKQTVVLQQPAFTDEYGDTVGNPELWRVDVIGKKVEQLGLTNEAFKGKKAKLTVYLNSSYIVGKDGKDDMYIINANLNAIELAPVKA